MNMKKISIQKMIIKRITDPFKEEREQFAYSSSFLKSDKGSSLLHSFGANSNWSNSLLGIKENKRG